MNNGIFRGLKKPVLFCLIFILFGIMTACNPDEGQENRGNWVAVGYDGVVRISYDGGINWVSGNSGHTNCIGCVATDSLGIWLHPVSYWSGEIRYSEIHISTDGGMNWQEVGFDTPNLLINDIESDRYGIHVIAVGKWENGLATVHYSLNGGYQWTHFPNLGHHHGLNAVATDDQGYWVVTGSHSTILRSSQPTLQWDVADIIRSFGENGSFGPVAFVGKRTVNNEDQNVWIVVGVRTDTQQPMAFKSLDGGMTWNWDNFVLLLGDNYFRDVESDGEGSCVIAGNDGLMYTSTDFGDNWTEVPLQSSGITVSIWSVAYDGTGRWMALLSDRTILISDDLINWTLKGPISPQHLTDVKFGE